MKKTKKELELENKELKKELSEKTKLAESHKAMPILLFPSISLFLILQSEDLKSSIPTDAHERLQFLTIISLESINIT